MLPPPSRLSALTSLEELELLTETRTARLHLLPSDGTLYVIKALRKELTDPHSTSRFYNEYNIGRTLEHPGVRRVLDRRIIEGSPCLVLEHVSGVSLQQLRGTTRLDLTQKLSIATRFARVLHALHTEELIVRDVKSANCIVEPQSLDVHLIDLGSATHLNHRVSSGAAVGALDGTLEYISPEQTGRTNRLVDSRSDLYSFGVVLYELFCGELPFTNSAPLELVHCHLARLPRPPSALQPTLPSMIDRIILKLLEKNPDDRYQSAHGVMVDLQACQDALSKTGQIAGFPLATRDHPGQLRSPRKLHGREKELQALVHAFESTMRGQPGTVMIRGGSGVGKTSVVEELRQTLAEGNGFFIQGKFDQYSTDFPLSALLTAFREFLGEMSCQPQPLLQGWRARLREGLGSHASILVEVLPELKAALGVPSANPPSLENLSPAERQHRFNEAFLTLLRATARAEHPLVLLLDDLQWADPRSLSLVKHMASDSQSTGFLLIGAYRDGEVDTHHPLHPILAELRGQERPLLELLLEPLDFTQTRAFISEALRTSPEPIHSLARVAFEKTGGNPFFLGALLRTLVSSRTLWFDFESGRWAWNEQALGALAISDNVIDLMMEKLKAFPDATQRAIIFGAYLGNIFRAESLSRLLGLEPHELNAVLRPAIRAELLIVTGGSARESTPYTLGRQQSSGGGDLLLGSELRFSHDRVRQAALGLLPEADSPRLRLLVARELLHQMKGSQYEDRIFDVVTHLQAAESLLRNPEERWEALEAHLSAAERARQSLSYREAKDYLLRARRFLPPNPWHAQEALCFRLWKALGENAFLSGDPALALETLEEASRSVSQTNDRALLCRMIIDIHLNSGQMAEAKALGFQLLADLGMQLPTEPEQIEADFLLSMRKIRAVSERTPLSRWHEFPASEEPRHLLMMDVLKNLVVAAFFAFPELLPMLTARGVMAGLDRGTAPPSGYFLSWLGYLLISLDADHARAFDAGTSALKMADRFQRFRGGTYHLTGAIIHHWKRPLREAIQLLVSAHRFASEEGDVVTLSHTVPVRNRWRFYSGAPLPEVLEEANTTLKLLEDIQSDFIFSYHSLVTRFFHRLTEEQPSTCLAQSAEEERALVAGFVENKMGIHLCAFHIMKATLGFEFGQYELAIEHAVEAEKHQVFLANTFDIVGIPFYSALARTVGHGTIDDNVERARARFELWARQCPENFLHKLDLLEAELARLRNQHGHAIEKYEAAITHALEHQFIQDAALAKELLGRHWLERKNRAFARVCIHEAIQLYTQWGATAKVRHLQRSFATLLGTNPEPAPGPEHSSETWSSSTPSSSTIQSLDLSTVLKSSQALSTEIIPERLFGKLMRIMLECSGAERGFFFLHQEGQVEIRAYAAVDSDEVRMAPIQCTRFSHGIVQRVLHGRAPLVVADASSNAKFLNDPYVREHHPRSILCMPILRQEKLLGILYIENNLVSDAFTRDRLELLSLLCSQAAISIDNATLYDELNQLNRKLEFKVQERTEELRVAQKKLLDAAHHAGMAEIAIRVLHNFGNILNSANVATHSLSEHIRTSRVYLLEKCTHLLQQHRDELGAFLSDTAKGQKLVELLIQLGESLPREHRLLAGDVNDLEQSVTTLIELVHEQQTYVEDANLLSEEVSLTELLEEVLATMPCPSAWSFIHLVKQYRPTPPVAIEKNKLKYILTSLLRNAVDALSNNPGEKRITLEIEYDPEQGARIQITDNGAGIPPGSLQRIFSHGFTTKQGGRGFSLHNCANAMTEMGGSISAQSDGPGQGATLTLLFPPKLVREARASA